MSKPTRPRMSDIARAANVNRITVSRALSHPELVAADTLQRVNETIVKMGYIPNQIARGMKAQHSRIVSLVTPPQMSGVYGAILETLARELYKSNLIINLFPVQGIAGEQEAVLRELAGWRPAAIAVLGTQLTQASVRILRDAHVPLIELLNYDETGPGTCVGYDQREAASALTEHLLQRGYGKVCYVHSARPDSLMNTLRLRGFSDAIVGHNGTLHLRTKDADDGATAESNALLPRGQVAGIELKSPPSFQAGYELMASLAAWQVMPEAVLFASDMVAVGALQYCISHGLRLRKDIALCAFDGIELTSVVQPRLTCLDLPYERVIAEGARQILARVQDQSTRGDRVRIPVHVLHRDST